MLETQSDRLLAAVRLLLAEKGIATPDEIAERIDRTDRASPAQGAAHGGPRLDRPGLPRR